MQDFCRIYAGHMQEFCRIYARRCTTLGKTAECIQEHMQEFAEYMQDSCRNSAEYMQDCCRNVTKIIPTPVSDSIFFFLADTGCHVREEVPGEEGRAVPSHQDGNRRTDRPTSSIAARRICTRAHRDVPSTTMPALLLPLVYIFQCNTVFPKRSINWTLAALIPAVHSTYNELAYNEIRFKIFDVWFLILSHSLSLRPHFMWLKFQSTLEHRTGLPFGWSHTSVTGRTNVVQPN